jgi:hypothetical protein
MIPKGADCRKVDDKITAIGKTYVEYLVWCLSIEQSRISRANEWLEKEHSYRVK